MTCLTKAMLEDCASPSRVQPKERDLFETRGDAIMLHSRLREFIKNSTHTTCLSRRHSVDANPVLTDPHHDDSFVLS